MHFSSEHLRTKHFWSQKRYFKSGVGLAVLAMSLLAIPAAHAQTTAFSNFGPRNTFNAGTGWTENGPDSRTAISSGVYVSQG